MSIIRRICSNGLRLSTAHLHHVQSTQINANLFVVSPWITQRNHFSSRPTVHQTNSILPALGSSLKYKQNYHHLTLSSIYDNEFHLPDRRNSTATTIRYFSSDSTKKPASSELGKDEYKPETNVEIDSTKKPASSELNKDEQKPETNVKAEPEKLSLTAKFKLMYKNYWYILVPVHIVTSCFWFGGFFYLSKSGVDVPAFLESLHFSESIVAKTQDSKMGHLAIAYLCYKIATPLRYTVTLGGTTVSIKYLSQWGYIKPMPSREKLRQMYDDQKAKFKQSKN